MAELHLSHHEVMTMPVSQVARYLRALSAARAAEVPVLPAPAPAKRGKKPVPVKLSFPDMQELFRRGPE